MLNAIAAAKSQHAIFGPLPRSASGRLAAIAIAVAIVGKVLGFILEKKLDDFWEISVQFRTQFSDFLRFEAQNSFRI